MERTARLVGILLAATLALGALTACEQVDPNSVEYHVQQVTEKKAKASIIALGDMKAKEGVDALMAAYDEGRFRSAIITSLAQIGDHKAVPTFIAAIGDKSEKESARLAGNTLIEWGVGEGNTDALLPILQDPGAPNENKYAALQLLAKYPDPKAIPALLNVLKADPDVQPIALAGQAAEALGKLKVDKAVSNLVQCLWLDDALGRNAVAECRLALNRIGPPAVPTLIATLERKNRRVEKRATKLKFDKGGIIEAKAAELLGDLGSPDAVEPLIAAMTSIDEMPPSVANNPQKAQAFVMSGVQKVISTGKALAATGDARAVKPLLEVAADKQRPLEHKLSAVQQIAFLGSTDAVKGLLDMLDDEVNQYDPVSQGFRVQLALAVANLIAADDKKGMKKLEKTLASIKKETGEWIEDNKKKIPTIKDARLKKGLEADIKGWNDQLKNFGEVEAKIAVVKECAGDMACYAGKLADANVAVQLLAAYRLSAAQGDDQATARAAIVKGIEVALAKEKLTLDDPVVLNALMFGLGRVGDASSAAKAGEFAAAAKARSQKESNKIFKGAFKGSSYTLELLSGSLAHR